LQKRCRSACYLFSEKKLILHGVGYFGDDAKIRKDLRFALGGWRGLAD
jgi:hypothetical protein